MSLEIQSRARKNRTRTMRRALFMVVFIFVLVATLSFFSVNSPAVISGPLHFIARPLWKMQISFRSRVAEVAELFRSKTTLIEKNSALEEDISELKQRLRDFFLLKQKNRELMAILGRLPDSGDESASLPIFGSVLVKPNRSPYGGIIIDVGSKEGVKRGDLVLSEDRVVLGSAERVFAHTSVVKLFSSPEIETAILLGESELPFDAIGRGGGNFMVRIPRDVEVKTGDTVMLADDASMFLGRITTTLENQADSFQIALFRSSTNLYESSWVEVVHWSEIISTSSTKINL